MTPQSDSLDEYSDGRLAEGHVGRLVPIRTYRCNRRPVVLKGITAHGVPQRLLTDNGAALNPSRRGAVGQLVTYVESLGVEAITGKPYKPTTRGKNERFRQTRFHVTRAHGRPNRLSRRDRPAPADLRLPRHRTHETPLAAARHQPGFRSVQGHDQGAELCCHRWLPGSWRAAASSDARELSWPTSKPAVCRYDSMIRSSSTRGITCSMSLNPAGACSCSSGWHVGAQGSDLPC